MYIWWANSAGRDSCNCWHTERTMDLFWSITEVIQFWRVDCTLWEECFMISFLSKITPQDVSRNTHEFSTHNRKGWQSLFSYQSMLKERESITSENRWLEKRKMSVRIKRIKCLLEYFFLQMKCTEAELNLGLNAHLILAQFARKSYKWIPRICHADPHTDQHINGQFYFNCGSRSGIAQA